MAVPGLAPGAQPVRAGARWRARPKRPSSGHRHAAGQIGGGGCGIGAQQHGRPSRSRRPRCPGQRTARQGELVLQPARPGGVPQPRPPRDVSKRHSEHRRESRHRLGQHELPDAHGVVAHENGHRPPGSDRRAHAGRRQTSSTCSEGTARNRWFDVPEWTAAWRGAGTGSSHRHDAPGNCVALQ